MIMQKNCPIVNVKTVMLLLCAIMTTGIFAQNELRTPTISTAITLSKNLYAAQDTVVAVLQVTIPNQYHLYANPLGPGIGKPLIITMPRIPGVRWINVAKSVPKKFNPQIGEWVWAYEKEAYIICKGVIENVVPGEMSGAIELNGLICNTACIPVNKKTQISLSVSTKKTQGYFEKNPDLREQVQRAVPMEFSQSVLQDVVQDVPDNSPLGLIALSPDVKHLESSSVMRDYIPQEKSVSMNILWAVIFGFIAGIILNFMPCVLPVLGIKILSFANTAGSSRRTAMMRSLVFSAGMMAVFMLLAALASFAHLSWGQQFQTPWFLIALITLAVVFSLSMFDVYMIGIPVDLSGLDKQSKHGVFGDFLRGVLATLLATPCSGPFLGTTLAWTLSQKTPVIFLIFASIGTGMAFPYILLSSSKRFMKLIPKPGKWMDDFKHIMGFFLLGASVYLMIGLPADLVIGTVAFCVIASFAVVIFSRIAPFGSSMSKKILATLVACLLIAMGGYISFVVLPPQTLEGKKNLQQSDNGAVWQEFSLKALNEAQDNGRPVIVDFTASWCMNCQYNFITVLTNNDVAFIIKKNNVLALKADITRENPEAEALMHKLGSRSVPFFAIFSKENPNKPIIMRDILNKGDVVNALQKL